MSNHCVENNFNKFTGIADPEEGTPNMWNQHQHHQGETQSQAHHYISIRLIAYKMHCICLFTYHYHVCVSFLDTLRSSLHEPRMHHDHSCVYPKITSCIHWKPTNGNTVFPTQNSHNTFHETLHSSSMCHFLIDTIY